MFGVIKNILYPKTCLNCKAFGLYICKSCQSKIKYLETQNCFYCHKVSKQGFTHIECQQPDGVDRSISIFEYRAPIKQVITNIKYRLVRDAFAELFALIPAEMMHQLINDEIYVQSIPLHPKRQAERGFNQAEYIAEWISKKMNRPRIHVLKRIKHNPPQAHLSKYERQQSIKGIFAETNSTSIKNKTVVLVDDVLTTGSTVDEATHILKLAGAYKVYVFTLAKD